VKPEAPVEYMLRVTLRKRNALRAATDKAARNVRLGEQRKKQCQEPRDVEAKRCSGKKLGRPCRARVSSVTFDLLDGRELPIHVWF
jgi:hypothetical protein